MDEAYQFLNHMVGEWTLTGVMGEIDLYQRVSADWVLGGNYLRMQVNSTAPAENPTASYEAIYHFGYNQDHGIYIMHLLDTTEVPMDCTVGRAQRLADSLPFLFQYEGTPFHNTFTWFPEPREWTSIQTYEQDGIMKTFATKRLSRHAA